MPTSLLAADRLSATASWVWVAVLGTFAAVALVWLARRQQKPSAALPERRGLGWLVAALLGFGVLHGGAFGKLYLLALAGDVVEAEVVQVERHQTIDRRRCSGWDGRCAPTFEVEARRGALTLRDATSEALHAAWTAARDGDRRPVPFVVVRWWPSLHQIGVAPGLESWRVVLGCCATLLVALALSGGLRRLDDDLERLLVAVVALLGATLSLCVTVGVTLAVCGLILRRHRGEPIDLFDGLCALLAAGLLFLQVHAIVRPRLLTFSIKGSATEVPTTSWAHLIVDAALLALAIVFARDGDAHFAIALLALPGTLLLLRLLFWRRRPRL